MRTSLRTDLILVILTSFEGLRRSKSVENVLYALYLLRGAIDYNQTCTDTLLGDEKEMTRFW